MKIYKVKVNGKLYEVELESVSEVAGSVSAPVKENAPAPAPTPASTGANTIKAPIAGKVLKLSVKVGDSVKKGQAVAIVEAMKLENEIPSAFDGTVKAILVKEGDAVENGQAIIELA